MSDSLCDHGRKPRLLDLFCGAGGAAMGYHRAGFEVVGVDIKPQPNYPFEFHQADALEVLDYEWWRWAEDRPGYQALAEPFQAIHASPPCQKFTAYRRKGHGVGDDYPDLIAQTRELLEAIGLPYVIENVPGAPLQSPLTLCGSSFDLDVRRHRQFESPWLPDECALACDHAAQVAKGKRFPGATNREGRYTCEIGVWRIPLDVQKRAMDVDWRVTLGELSQMVPPAYTEHLGRELAFSALRREAVAA